jgi:hypothetical protein
MRFPPGRSSRNVDGDLFKGRCLDEHVPAEKAGFLGAYECLRPGRRPPEADQMGAGRFT